MGTRVIVCRMLRPIPSEEVHTICYIIQRHCIYSNYPSPLKIYVLKE